MLNQVPADCARLRLYLSTPDNNRGDTSHCTTPTRFRPYRKVHSHSAETISQARCLRNHPHPRLSPEIAPAMCWPSIFRRDEIHRPTHTFFLINRHVRQIQTPLRSANVCLPISRKLPRQGTRCGRQDNSPCL